MIIMRIRNPKQPLTTRLEQWNKCSCPILSIKTSSDLHTQHKKWSFLLNKSLVNLDKAIQNSDLFTRNLKNKTWFFFYCDMGHFAYVKTQRAIYKSHKGEIPDSLSCGNSIAILINILIVCLIESSSKVSN